MKRDLFTQQREEATSSGYDDANWLDDWRERRAREAGDDDFVNSQGQIMKVRQDRLNRKKGVVLR